MSFVLAAGPAPTALTAPSIEYQQILPMIIVFGVATLGVLVEAFAPRPARYPAQLVLGLSGLVAAFVAVVGLAGTRSVATEGSVAVDGPTLFLQGTILLLSVLAVLTIGERALDAGGDAFAAEAAAVPGSARELTLTRAGVTQTEVFPLTMFAVGGMLLFPAANDLLTMFVALEVLSLPLYLLCAMARRRRLLSQEAALKYFLLGAFSSGFFLYGIALVYGYAGTLDLGGIAEAVSSRAGNDPLLLTGTALVGVGLLFKVSASPFHAWTPDVYQGAPTPITGFMAACTKAAAFGALLRVFYVAFGGAGWDWKPMMSLVAALTMVVGAVVAITQTDVKRMLGYSSVAHAGFLLTGVVALNHEGITGVLFYLLAYGFATIGAFAVVPLVRDAAGEATHLTQWAGLGRRSPIVGAVFSLFLLSLAGIPLTAGFISKFAVFEAAIAGDAALLVVVGVVTSAVAAFFYAKVIVLMFFSEPGADGPSVAVPSVLTTTAVAVAAAVTVVLGVAPQAVLDLADQAAVFVR
jgi:NADH-quinone oxidoreductase subunit N